MTNQSMLNPFDYNHLVHAENLAQRIGGALHTITCTEQGAPQGYLVLGSYSTTGQGQQVFDQSTGVRYYKELVRFDQMIVDTSAPGISYSK